jgi:hypothetical protein
MTNTNRYEVIADYPKCTVSVGQILHAETPDEKAWCDKYPHLFRLLNWWEHVPKNELPEYVKGKLLTSKPVGVFKVIWKVQGGSLLVREFDHNIFSWFVDCNLLPATESEYNDYLNKLNSK